MAASTTSVQVMGQVTTSDEPFAFPGGHRVSDANCGAQIKCTPRLDCARRKLDEFTPRQLGNTGSLIRGRAYSPPRRPRHRAITRARQRCLGKGVDERQRAISANGALQPSLRVASSIQRSFLTMDRRERRRRKTCGRANDDIQMRIGSIAVCGRSYFDRESIHKLLGK